MNYRENILISQRKKVYTQFAKYIGSALEEGVSVKVKNRTVLAWLILIIIIFNGTFLGYSELRSGVDEPVLMDNLVGNWTASWILDNPGNYSLSNIELEGGSAKLQIKNISLTENKDTGFPDGTWQNLKTDPKGIALDKDQNYYSMIADKNNNRVIKIDFEKWICDKNGPAY